MGGLGRQEGWRTERVGAVAAPAPPRRRRPLSSMRRRTILLLLLLPTPRATSAAASRCAKPPRRASLARIRSRAPTPQGDGAASTTAALVVRRGRRRRVGADAAHVAAAAVRPLPATAAAVAAAVGWLAWRVRMVRRPPPRGRGRRTGCQEAPWRARKRGRQTLTAVRSLFADSGARKEAAGRAQLVQSNEING